MNNHLGCSLKIGTVLNDKCVILEFIGKGGMGEVYRAHQCNLKRDTAIKVISPEWLESFEGHEKAVEATLQRFQREVEAMARTRHPNVLQIFDYDSTSIKKGDEEIPIQYIVMEYVPGSTLRSTMSEDGFYPDEEASRSWIHDYFLPVLKGIQAVHELGIIHRDLKPENILLDGSTPKIADFGLARTDHLLSVTQTIDSKGTPSYMPPEQFRDFKGVDERADVYALGKILYEAIDGRMTPKTAMPFQCAALKKADTPFFQRLDHIVCESTAEDKTKRLATVERLWSLLVEAMGADAEEPRARKGEGFRRELAAILIADVEGYSRLMEQDDIATIRILKEYREIMAEAIQDHHGRLVDSSGDNMLAEFMSVVDAVECAVDVQETLKAKNADLPEDRRMAFRVGINLGDLVKEGDQVYGDGVNAAARIAGLAAGGGICISRGAYDQVKNRLSLDYAYLGEHSVKNLTEPVRVYGIQMEAGPDKMKAIERRPRRRPWHWKGLSLAVLLALAAVGALVWTFYSPTSTVPPKEAPAEKETALSSSARTASGPSVGSPSEGEIRPQAAQTSSQGRVHPVDADQEAMKGPGLFPHVEGQHPMTVARVAPDRELLRPRKGRMQDKAGGISQAILKRQSTARVEAPPMEVAVSLALKAAEEEAQKLMDPVFHKGETLHVPEPFKSIQDAIDHAKPGDVILVREGRYFESIVMKDGVKLVSDSAHGGDRPVSVEGAQLRLPARTLRTVIDGSDIGDSAYWVIDFEESAGRNTIVDGFTIENLPIQDQHVFAHAQAINVRGASPVIMNSYIRKNASMGIGSHVVFKDVTHSPSDPKGHFQWTDVKKKAEPVIYGNVICQNLGQGIRCNPFSSPSILGNEIFLNVYPYSTELGEKPSPGLGTKYGAAPTLMGNVVHDQPGGGILCDAGRPQALDGTGPPMQPTILKNVVFRSGEHGSAILCGGGTTESPVRCAGNLIYDAGWVGIDLLKDGICTVEDNVVSGAAGPGIRVDGATVVKLNRNKVTGANAPGFIIKNGGNVLEMVANVSDQNKGPRFVLRNATIAKPDL
ncbi:MAG: protein kinase [Thermodesulfobacteriota bacterium]|nr:protein kinase [Thermodesulfobacteriota bacterium]